MPSDSDHASFHGFAGRTRLFPLPNVVLFPHVIQALHVFELRYREMTADALAGDQLITMALLAPGWEPHYDGRPALRPVACLGRIATHHVLPDGRYNLLLLGLKRVRLVEELPAEHGYREGLVQVIEDEYPAGGAANRQRIQRQLLDGFRRALPLLPDMQEQVEQFMSSDVSLGILTDILAYSLPLPFEQKLLLLGEANVDRRAEQLADYLLSMKGDGQEARHSFPPEFSEN